MDAFGLLVFIILALLIVVYIGAWAHYVKKNNGVSDEKGKVITMPTPSLLKGH